MIETDGIKAQINLLCVFFFCIFFAMTQTINKKRETNKNVVNFLKILRKFSYRNKKIKKTKKKKQKTKRLKEEKQNNVSSLKKIVCVYI